MQVLLGTKTMEYHSLQGGADLDPNTTTGLTPWRPVWRALQNGELLLADQVGGLNTVKRCCMVQQGWDRDGRATAAAGEPVG